MTFTITAFLDHPDAPQYAKSLYCFDDPDRNLRAEPLMDQATDAIQAVLPDTASVQLTFGLDPDELLNADPNSAAVLVQLDYMKPQDDGSLYGWMVLAPEKLAESTNFAQMVACLHTQMWLCPALLSYFPTAPKHFFVLLKPAVFSQN